MNFALYVVLFLAIAAINWHLQMAFGNADKIHHQVSNFRQDITAIIAVQ